MKKILAGFYEAKTLYDEAHERDDTKNELKLGGDFIAYVEKFQKELNFSDEALKDMKDSLSKAQKSVKKKNRSKPNSKRSGAKEESSGRNITNFCSNKRPKAKTEQSIENQIYMNDKKKRGEKNTEHSEIFRRFMC